ncbi:helix-turn-helix domain-containing protein [Pseudonocardia spirodelae]|uniref:helix-turn-helix domain-containing protein n=1 Tax=Pseudonocardia spirodelae TaxID=3133431 RepID=UPI003BF6089D
MLGASRTASALGVHRHTVRHRVEAAERVSGRRLSSAQDRHELWLALQARDLGRAGGSAPAATSGRAGSDRF